ncbi:MAG: hypothetical protein R3219_05125, partial [Hydrogenovibrio sp.]|nr:hypothetical protein [Hydrogenovibrio sp.]
MQTSRTIRQTLQLSDSADIQEHPSPFADSSHQIFMVEDNHDKRVIKVPNPSNRHASDFWQWMSTCFDVTLETQIAQFPQLYPMIEHLSPLRIPALQGQQSLQDGILLTQTGFLPGRPLTSSDLTDSILQSLARHMAALHQKTSSVFGDLQQNQRHTAQRWMERLRAALA